MNNCITTELINYLKRTVWPGKHCTKSNCYRSSVNGRYFGATVGVGCVKIEVLLLYMEGEQCTRVAQGCADEVLQIRDLGSTIMENLQQRTQFWKAAFQALRNCICFEIHHFQWHIEYVTYTEHRRGVTPNCDGIITIDDFTHFNLP